MNCPKCGVEINPEQVLCVKCGYQIREVSKKKGSNTGCIIGAIVGFFLFVFFGGCIAAIAYPQYVRAVELSRAREANALITTLAQSEERYYLANAKYTEDFSALDIAIPDSTIKNKSAETNFFVYEINLPYISVTRKDDSSLNYSLRYNIQTKENQCKGSDLMCKYL